MKRTYAHLEGLGRKPTDYDIGSSQLLYYPGRGFEVATPIAEWYARYQQGSPLRSTRWEQVSDPAQLTYASYTEQRRDREIYVDGLLQAIETASVDTRADAGVVAGLVGPLRFVFHGLQMIGAYVGSMAPSGKIAIAHAFQAADDMRRVQRLAYRLRQLQIAKPGATDPRADWLTAPAWQPLRELVERLLVTYDWGEALVALDIVVRPLVEEAWLVHAGRLVAAAGDELTPKLLLSLHDDGAWQRDYTRALVAVVAGEDPAQLAVIERWRAIWWQRASAAIDSVADARPGVERVLADYWRSLGIGGAA